MKTVYISGPISNIPNHNREAFAAASKLLIEKGYVPVNPLEIISDQGASWSECMKADIAELMRCDGVFVLDGWTKSKGASLEVLIASRLFIPVFDSSFATVDTEKMLNWDLLKEPGIQD
jgi:hypothetical protein